MPFIVDNEEFLNLREAQEFLGNVSQQSIKNYVKAGKLTPHVRDIAHNQKFYKKSELQKLLEFRPEETEDEQ